MSQGICQFKKEVGLLFHAQEIFQEKRSQFFFFFQNFSKKISWWTRHAGKRERDGALTWREYIGYIRRDSSNTINGLLPYQSLGNLTSQTNEKRNEGCWKKGSIMRSQPLYQQIHDIFSPKRTYVHQSSTRSPRQESRKIGVFSKNESTISVSYWILEKRRFNNIWRTCDRRYWNKRKQGISVRLTSVAIGSMLRPEAQALHS